MCVTVIYINLYANEPFFLRLKKAHALYTCFDSTHRLNIGGREKSLLNTDIHTITDRAQHENGFSWH